MLCADSGFSDRVLQLCPRPVARMARGTGHVRRVLVPFVGSRDLSVLGTDTQASIHSSLE
eukprot:3721422-Prymnesium_polylepis.1